MFTHQVERAVESICYDNDHISKVLTEITKNFDTYFEEFIKTESGTGVTENEFQKLQKSFNTKAIKKGCTKDSSIAFKNIIRNSREEFEKDRQKYLDIFDFDTLLEYEDDPSYFKSKILKNECPIIHATLFNRVKELDKYREQFGVAKSKDLLSVVIALCKFSKKYMNEKYDDIYKKIVTIDDLCLSQLDSDESYTVYGVIGGGIKSHMLFKLYPSAFSNRSRNALWSLWYLSGKFSFGCKKDSEFLMIDVKNSITQQNYFYPYDLFSFYAFKLFCLLKQKAQQMNVYIETEYRYVIVDAFFDFVAKQNKEAIDLFKTQIQNGGLGYE